MRETTYSEKFTDAKAPKLSAEQQNARDKIRAWLPDTNRQIFHLDGYAGTGKTTIAAHIPKLWPGPVHFAFTGKAASRLRQLGCADATTVHRLIYHPPQVDIDADGHEQLLWEPKAGAVAGRALLVLDECSTIGPELWEDLCAIGVKIVAIGDPFQLPPINGWRVFDDGAPDVLLTEIHRQALHSPVLRLATDIRQGHLPQAVPHQFSTLLDADIVICALNTTRRNTNAFIRRRRGIRGSIPVIGDRVVALRNDYARGLLNGTLWSVESVVEAGPNLQLHLVDDQGNAAEALTPRDCFVKGLATYAVPREFQPLDFGYCITCHKAQGSEWSRVVVLDETDSRGFGYIAGDLPFDEFRRRWLYTAVTRASDAVTIMKA